VEWYGCCTQHNYEVDSGAVMDNNTPDLLTSGSGRGHMQHTDAQTLAMMLQEQLDVINNEIRYISLALTARSDCRRTYSVCKHSVN